MTDPRRTHRPLSKMSAWLLSGVPAMVCLLGLMVDASAVAQDRAAAGGLALPATDEGLPGAGPIRRAEWFQNTWLKRRSEFAADAQYKQGAVVMLGDSITQGWGGRLAQFFPDMNIANRGISGDTTRGMLIRLQPDVLALKPSGVVLLMGTNDLEEQAEPQTIAGNIQLILRGIKQHDPALPVVLCLVMPSAEKMRRPADKIKQLNQLLMEAVKGDPQITVLDTWTLFADAQGDAKPEEFPDLLHLNDAGYARWAAALRPLFATLGYTEREADAFALEPGFESLFNGRDLTGWGFRVDEQGRGRAAKFDGQTESDDGRYVAKAGRLIVTTPPEGRRIQQLWTHREFPSDFILKLEFRATPNADSGVFIRGPQLQCRDYWLAGPYKELKSYNPQDWNEIVVEVRGGVAHCTCNGEVLEAEFKLPATGPIGLEGDRGQMEYRRIRVKPL
jgi:lysophospholipase L1-like esterase